jgi:hypothetical protein
MLPREQAGSNLCDERIVKAFRSFGFLGETQNLRGDSVYKDGSERRIKQQEARGRRGGR